MQERGAEAGEPGIGPSETRTCEEDLLRRIHASLEDLAAGGGGHELRASDGRHAALLEVHERIRSLLLDVRRSYEGRLREAESLAVSALAALPDPVFVLSPAGEVKIRNAAAGELLSKLEHPDRLLRILSTLVAEVVQEERDSVPVSLQAALNLELRSRESLCMLPKVIRLQSEPHGAAGLTIILQEVTEFRAAEERSQEVMGLVSHELRSPLTSLRMAISLLLEQRMGNLNRQQKEMLGIARGDLDGLIRLLNEVMEVTRFRRDREPSFATLPVEELLEECVRECAEAIDRNQTEIRLQIEPELPPLLAERKQLQRAMRHLLLNAVRNSPVKGCIILGAYPAEDEDCVAVFVKDSGRGMSAAERGRVFSRGHHLSNPNEHGLGLSVAQEIVMAHAGSLECLSRPGEGATFTAVLPTAHKAGDPRHDSRRADAGEISCAAKEAGKIVDS